MTLTALLVYVNQSVLLVDSQDYYQHPSEVIKGLLLTVKKEIQVMINSLEQISTASNHETSFYGLGKAITQIISIVILWSYVTNSN